MSRAFRFTPPDPHGLLRFSSPSPPAPQPLPAAPALDPVQQAQAAQTGNEQQLAALGGGRASTILTGPLGDTGDDHSVVKTLLGG